VQRTDDLAAGAFSRIDTLVNKAGMSEGKSHG